MKAYVYKCLKTDAKLSHHTRSMPILQISERTRRVRNGNRLARKSGWYMEQKASIKGRRRRR